VDDIGTIQILHKRRDPYGTLSIRTPGFVNPDQSYLDHAQSFSSLGSGHPVSGSIRASRKFLYGLRDKALVAISMGLLSQKPGRTANTNMLKVDQGFIRWAIAVLLSIVPDMVQTTQLLLELLFQVYRSVGSICQTAKELGHAVAEHHQSLPLSLLALAEADEIFQGRRPCLTLVEGRSHSWC
jgi:hypothetical protein